MRTARQALPPGVLASVCRWPGNTTAGSLRRFFWLKVADSRRTSQVIQLLLFPHRANTPHRAKEIPQRLFVTPAGDPDDLGLAFLTGNWLQHLAAQTAVGMHEFRQDRGGEQSAELLDALRHNLRLPNTHDHASTVL